jgi:hypothetical protein
MRPLIAHCHLGLGEVYRRDGERRRAEDEMTTAARMYEEMSMPQWRTRAEETIKEGR